MLKRIIKYLFVAGLFSTAVGCTYEDPSICSPGAKMRFNYSPDGSGVNLFGQDVDKVTLYVFDNNNIYYGTYSSQAQKLTNDFMMSLPLLVGRYKILTLGGAMGTYSVGSVNDSPIPVFNNGLVKGVTTLDQFRFMVDVAANKIIKAAAGNEVVVSSEIDDLFYGNVIEATLVSDRETDVTVNLISVTHKLKATIHGLDNLGTIQPVSGSPLDVYCTSDNGTYKWDGLIDQNVSIIKYTPYAETVAGESLEANFKVMRLVDGTPLILTVVNPVNQHKLFNLDLVALIMKNPKYGTQAALDSEAAFNVELNILKNLTVEVSVNGWKVIDVIPEI